MKTLICLLLLSTAAFAKDHTYKSGKLLSIDYSESLTHGTSRKNAIYMVKLDDIVYTLQGGHVWRTGSDESSIFTVGDPVQVSVEGNDVFVLKPDGKVMKSVIVKRERADK